MKKILITAMVVLMIIVSAGCSSNNKKSGNGSASSDKKQKTITLGVTPWSSTVPPTEIASLILQDMGYKVKETKADVGSVFMGLSRGDIDVFMDAWLPMHQKYLDKFKGNIKSIAVSYPKAETGWTVPKYMKNINTLQDLKGHEDEFDNKFYGIEAGTSSTEESNKVIKAYNFDLTQVNSSEGGMLAQVKRRISQKKPVVFFGWRPHTMFNKFDLKVLTNKKGFFKTSSVQVIANNDLKKNAPDAYKFLSNWNISIDDVEEMITKIDAGKDPKKVAQEWIDNHQDKVNKMMGK